MSDPKIITIVSGKGGVGKTMLAVAIATEISRKKRTLLIDFDFFNRGLTGLFASSTARSRQIPVSPPEIFSEQVAGLSPDKGQHGWSIVEVEPNLLTLNYEDLDKSKLDILEAMDTAVLSNILRQYVVSLAEKFDCKIVVLDCHGGPDNTSFAACLLATRSILVSEPDRITLHGTLNFLRTLRREAPDVRPKIQLVFNKVVPAFTPLFLFKFYKEFLISEFDGDELLAIYPLEVYLTKAFEKNPTLTSVYPHSQLAEKTRLVLFKLFENEKSVLPKSIASMSYARRIFIEYYMGRWPRVLNLDFILKVISIYAISALGGSYVLINIFDIPENAIKRTLGFATSDDQFASSLYNELSIVFVPLFLWFSFTLLLTWTKDIDTYIVYFLRIKSIIISILLFILLCTIWFAFCALLGGINSNPANYYIADLGVILTIIALNISILLYFIRGILSFYYEEDQTIEGLFRIMLTLVAFSTIIRFA
jgi:cellulose biosynthesis protein BcsQ